MEIFVVLEIVWLSAGFNTEKVTHQKRYSGDKRAIGGFLFNCLNCRGGLSDRKLTKYLK